jgi:energy-coupling factor transporter ATP-binding protein EcfA2/tetrahydromethanopterin S-methyltransferase subunit B
MQLSSITIENFMTIKHMYLEFKPNTAYGVVGDNDIGKTAFLMSIQALTENISAQDLKYFIRDNCEFFRIDGTDFEGNTFTLVRGAENFYRVQNADGTIQTYNNVGAKVPPELQKRFNIYKDYKSGIVLNHRFQDTPLFMIFSTDQDNYNVFQRALKTEELLIASDSLKAEQKRLYNSMDYIESEIDVTQAKANAIPDYEDLINVVEHHESSIEIQTTNIENINSVIELYDSIEKLESRSLPKEIINYSTKEVMDKLLLVKQLTELVALYESVEQLEATLEPKQLVIDAAKDLTREKVNVTSKLMTLVSNWEDYLLLKDKVSTKNTVISAHGALVLAKTTADNLVSSVNNIETIENMEQIVKDLSDKQDERLDVINTYSSLTKRYNITSSLTELSSKWDSYTHLKDTVMETSTKLEASKEALQDFMRDNSFCTIVATTGACPFDKFTEKEAV